MKKKISLTILLTSTIAVLVMFFVGAFVVYNELVSHTQAVVKQAAQEASAMKIPTDDYEPLPGGELRYTWIGEDGTVLYDSIDPNITENHGTRLEFLEAQEFGTGESLRNSDTLSVQMYYYAILLDNHTVLRVSCPTSSYLGVIASSLNILVPVLILVLLICLWIASKQTHKIIDPINQLNLQAPLSNQTYPELTPLLENLEQHNQMRQEFSANVSHELKTPLTSISGYAEIMSEGLVKPEDQKAFSKKIYDESQSLIEKINDIIKISKLDEDNVGLQFESMNYKTVGQHVLSRLMPESERKNISMESDLQDVYGTGIPTVLEDVVYNLVQNAVKYTPASGKVKLSIEQKGSNAVITVTDNGPGIPQEDMPRLYERFFRGDKAHGTTIEGSGLGLAIVKHGVQLHQGTINCDSIVGKGTTFTVTLPLKKTTTTS